MKTELSPGMWASTIIDRVTAFFHKEVGHKINTSSDIKIGCHATLSYITAHIPMKHMKCTVIVHQYPPTPINSHQNQNEGEHQVKSPIQ